MNLGKRVRLVLLSFAFLPFLAHGEYEDLQEALRDIKILFVPGYMPIEGSPFAFGIHSAYAGTADMLGSMGLDVEVSRVPAGSTAEIGDPILAAELTYSEKRVLVIGHSNGGNRILRTMAKYPEAAANAAGAVFVQSPLHGILISELARYLIEPETGLLDAHSTTLTRVEKFYERLRRMDPLGILRAILFFEFGKKINQQARRGMQKRTEMLFRMHGGDPQVVLQELSVRYTSEFFDQYREQVKRMGRQFPMLSVSSSGRSKNFCASQLALEVLGHATDGVVEYSSHDLGLGMLTYVHGADHLDLVVRHRDFEHEWAGLLRKIVRAPQFAP